MPCVKVRCSEAMNDFPYDEVTRGFILSRDAHTTATAAATGDSSKSEMPASAAAAASLIA